MISVCRSSTQRIFGLSPPVESTFPQMVSYSAPIFTESSATGFGSWHGATPGRAALHADRIQFCKRKFLGARNSIILRRAGASRNWCAAVATIIDRSNVANRNSTGHCDR
jgi:hypothetical protein